MEESVSGYIDYAKDVFFKLYSSDEMRQIIDRRDSILDKYKNEAGISRADLQDASDNYKKLTDEQAAEVLLRVAKSSVPSTIGAAYSGGFFVPIHYEGMIVDAEDVFAVGYTSDYNLEAGSNEVILCAVFTNDPFVPVFPMIYVGKIGFFDFVSSGIFDTKKMHSDLFSGSMKMLDRIGYIPEEDVNVILHMDKMFNRNYWNKQIKNLSKMG